MHRRADFETSWRSTVPRSRAPVSVDLSRRLRSAGLLLATALAALMALPASAIEFGFSQISWLDGSGGYTSQYSDWGRVEIGLTSADDPLFHAMDAGGVLGRGGYINIVTTVQGVTAWSVENLPIFYTDPLELYDPIQMSGRLPQGVAFDLGVTAGTPGTPGVQVSNLNYYYTIDPVPLAAMPSGASGPAPVVNLDYRAGGDNLWLGTLHHEGGSQTTPAPAKKFEGAKPTESIGSVAKITKPETSVAAVNEDNNGCAPGSVTRSLKYLDDAHASVTISDNTDKVYGDMKVKMNTDAAGTSTPEILSGKNAYVNDKKLPIVSTQTTDFKKAMDTLKKGGDVEVGVSWGTGTKDGKPASLGAHRAFVSEIQEIKDSSGNTTGYVVKIIDDPNQGDGKAENKTHTLKFDAAGKLVQHDGTTAATGAGLINFQTEDVVKKAPVRQYPATAPKMPKNGKAAVKAYRCEGASPAVDVCDTLIEHKGTTRNGTELFSTLTVTAGEPVEPDAPGVVRMDLEVEAFEPLESTFLALEMGLEHLRPDSPERGTLTPAILGDPEYLFVKDLVETSSFFDITYQVSMPEQALQIYRLHGEVPDALEGKVWIQNLAAIAQGPPGVPDSFFDVFLAMNVEPSAGGLFGADQPLLNMQLTIEQVPEPGTFAMLAAGFVALLAWRRRNRLA